MKSKFRNLSSVQNRRLVGISAAALVTGLFVFWATLYTRAQAPSPTDASTPPTASVAQVVRENLFKEVTIPAEFRPYEEVELHAKVSGYVSQMNVDFGDQVKAGELMATLEVPELLDELHTAQATEQKAEADHVNAHLIYTRLTAVNHDHPNLVAEQDLDTAEANDQTTAAAIAAAKADVEKYQTLVDYTKIIAPFDGVITRRYADPGALIQAGTDTQAKSLLRISDNYRLRLDFPVTVDYVKDIELGAPVEVRVESLNGKLFTGKISRFTHDVDDDTRTMITEIEVANPDLKLVPGMYATVVLRVENHPAALAIPIGAVSNLQNPTVLVVNHDHQIEEHPVQLGLEMPDKYEVLSGVNAGDLVIIGNRSEFQPGEKVEPRLLQLSMRNENPD
jgi:RND family efflux transporter MFP subunit